MDAYGATATSTGSEVMIRAILRTGRRRREERVLTAVVKT